MTVVLSDTRFHLMEAMVFVTDHCQNFTFTLENCVMAGTLGDIGCTWDDAKLAMKESVAIGHAEQSGYEYAPTQMGRDWLEAERAVRQSVADALERAAGGAHGA